MYCRCYNICVIKMYDNNSTKDERGKTEVYCFKFLTPYVTWYNVI